MSRPGTGVSLGRPATALSALSSPTGGKAGVKRQLDYLGSVVGHHTEELARLEAAQESKGNAFGDALAAMEARLMAQIEDVRREMRERFDGTRAAIDQLKENLKAQAGDASVLQEQTKDSHKRIVELSHQLHELNVEIMGD